MRELSFLGSPPIGDGHKTLITPGTGRSRAGKMSTRGKGHFGQSARPRRPDPNTRESDLARTDVLQSADLRTYNVASRAVIHAQRPASRGGVDPRNGAYIAD